MSEAQKNSIQKISSMEALRKPELILVAFQDTSISPPEEAGTMLSDSLPNKKILPKYKDYKELASWLDKALSEEHFPKWSSNNSISLERCVGYLEELIKEVQKAVRRDRHGEISIEDMMRLDEQFTKMYSKKDQCEKQIRWLRNNLAQEDNENMEKVGELIDKVDNVGKAQIKELEARRENDKFHLYYPSKEELEEQKSKPQSQNEALGYCKAHNAPLYDNECLLCTGEAKEDYTVDGFIVDLDDACEAALKRSTGDKDILKEAATPQITFVVDPFIHAICTIMLESKAQAGHNIEEVYEKLDKKYKFDDRDKLSILHTLRNMGFVYFLDRSGTEFMKNYFASSNGTQVEKKGN